MAVLSTPAPGHAELHLSALQWPSKCTPVLLPAPILATLGSSGKTNHHGRLLTTCNNFHYQMAIQLADRTSNCRPSSKLIKAIPAAHLYALLTCHPNDKHAICNCASGVDDAALEAGGAAGEWLHLEQLSIRD